MRMADLSAAAAVSIPSIKFYLREGLLHAGTRLARNQASYDESHVRRLRLIRALRDVADVPIEAIRGICAALDREESSMWRLQGAVAEALGGKPPAHLSPTEERASADVKRFLARQALPTDDAGACWELTRALVALRDAFGEELPVEVFELYVKSLDRVASAELQSSAEFVPDAGPASRADQLTFMVYGTVLFEPVILALRRILHHKHAYAALGGGGRSESTRAEKKRP